ncbi:3-phosphoshikimate 1-carboxyvinyltransferase [Lacicoccus alkaliphilus]|uniref:3-phosphoshikimate 1-carboxyvinyltransferase n=1 Tax=Lacicoccus alkaliphilus DSM 16010 TaxID=1123231 RepID=A0A1M7BA04_9BACL|nr:3-phosphoshikimate 1-carboxyvinyltransferase [Salinicoccus alkaliphilus]SHL51822.1 3-phosphoshikimate 1-carboxyvinyltransferase [Salinicoccus alkaliphilus DSM 16010]
MKSLLNHTFTGTIQVPGDKSITHRALMMASLAEGTSVIHSPLESEDTFRTAEIMGQLGVEIKREDDRMTVVSPGSSNFTTPEGVLYTGNSGTTTRLLMGLIAGLGIEATIEGDSSIAGRPMDRVATPLGEMGADISLVDGKYPPIVMKRSSLSAIEYEMPVASAQVKSAILFAALYADGGTTVHEKVRSRNHTEIMLEQFGVDIEVDGLSISMKGGQSLSANDVQVPGDISSAAFLMVLAAITEGSDIMIENVSMNETRAGIIDVFKQMNADIEIEEVSNEGEAIGNIHVRHSKDLTSFDLSGEIIPRLIDEIPVLAVLGAFGRSPSFIKGAEELRYKETDRLRAVIDELVKFGVEFEEYEDGFMVYPLKELKVSGREFKGYHDHRIIMMLLVMAISTGTEINIDDTSAINISYPEFLKDLQKLKKAR